MFPTELNLYLKGLDSYHIFMRLNILNPSINNLFMVIIKNVYVLIMYIIFKRVDFPV